MARQTLKIATLCSETVVATVALYDSFVGDLAIPTIIHQEEGELLAEFGDEAELPPVLTVLAQEQRLVVLVGNAGHDLPH